MKTAEELNALKEEVEALNRKLAGLSEEELKQVTGGFGPDFRPATEPAVLGDAGDFSADSHH